MPEKIEIDMLETMQRAIASPNGLRLEGVTDIALFRSRFYAERNKAKSVGQRAFDDLTFRPIKNGVLLYKNSQVEKATNDPNTTEH